MHTLVAFAAFVGLALASQPVARDLVQLSDGSGLVSGTVNVNLSWQSTGILDQGCTSSASHPILISDCYTLALSDDPTTNLDPGFPDSPRQRIEFLTPKGAAGTIHKFKWRYYLSSQTGSNSNFFHIMQLLSRSGSQTGPLITLDVVKGQVSINDIVRGCTACPSIPLADFTDRTTWHEVAVTYGNTGSFKYTVKSVTDNNTLLLTYSASGFMGEDASIKYGTYRKAVSGMSIARAVVGDFQVEI